MTGSSLPLISAITPCLNDALYLPEMIESFLSQDYPNKELVVQDGGSTDGTLEILSRYPVMWNVGPDIGPHDAINKAILASRGDIVVIMPANDFFAPGAFSRVAEALRIHPEAAMVYGDSQILDLDGSVARIHRPGPLDIDSLLWTYCILLQSSYIRRNTFDRVGLFDSKIKGPGDTEWILRMVTEYSSDSFFYVPEVWSSFRIAQSMNCADSRDWEQGANVLLAAHERFLAVEENRLRLRNGLPRARAGMYCQNAAWLSDAGKRDEAIKNLAAALSHWPGLLWTSQGLRYVLRVLLGRNVTRAVAKYKLKLSVALNFRPDVDV